MNDTVIDEDEHSYSVEKSSSKPQIAQDANFDGARLSQLLWMHNESKHKNRHTLSPSERRRSFSSLASNKNASISHQARSSLAILAKAYDSKPLPLSVKHRESLSRVTSRKSTNESASEATERSTPSNDNENNSIIASSDLTLQVDKADRNKDISQDENDSSSVKISRKPLHSQESIHNSYLYMMSTLDQQLTPKHNETALQCSQSDSVPTKLEVLSRVEMRSIINIDKRVDVESVSNSISVESYSSENAYLHQLAHITGNKVNAGMKENNSSLERYLLQLDKLAADEQSLSDNSVKEVEASKLVGSRFSSIFLISVIVFCMFMLTLQDFRSIQPHLLENCIPSFIMEEINIKFDLFDEYIKILQQYEKEFAARIIRDTTFYSILEKSVPIKEINDIQPLTSISDDSHFSNKQQVNVDTCVDDFFSWLQAFEDKMIPLDSEAPLSLTLPIMLSSATSESLPKQIKDRNASYDEVMQRHRQRIRTFWTARTPILFDEDEKNRRINKAIDDMENEDMDDYMRKKSKQFWNLLEEVVQDEQEDIPLMDFAGDLLRIFTKKKKAS